MGELYWIALSYHLPSDSSKSRVYLWRKLRELGAENLRPGIAVLPRTPENLRRMRQLLQKIREMVDTNTIVGQPITTPDGVTLIPISKVSFGFGSGGGDYGKTPPKDFGGGSAAGVKIDPVAFLIIKDGTTRVYPVAVPPVSTVDRIVDMAPDIVDKIGKFFDKKEDGEIV